MLLSNYLKEKNLSLKDFSLITRLSIPVIYRVLKEQNIYPRSARRIFLKTAGMVDYKNIRDFPVTAENYNA
jgi:predicted transcriptional regulator